MLVAANAIASGCATTAPDLTAKPATPATTTANEKVLGLARVPAADGTARIALRSCSCNGSHDPTH
jgi:hypothetical protein